MMKKLTILLLALCLAFVLFSCGDCDHADANTDGECDKCESVIGTCTHEDSDSNAVCDKCGAVVSITLNCTHSYFKVVVSEATCTEGTTYYDKCMKCGMITEPANDNIPRGHQWEQTNNPDCLVSTATCLVKAIYKEECSVCGSKDGNEYFYGSVIPHNYEFHANEDTLRELANCQHGNLFASICTMCGGEHEELVESGPRLKHQDSHGDDVCDACGMPFVEWDDVPTDNKTDIAPLSKEEEN